LSACKNCFRELPADALACAGCHTLVHADELNKLAAQAKAYEAQDVPRLAREEWLKGLPLLPPESKQASWIRTHSYYLETMAKLSENADPAPDHAWAKKFAPLAPIAVLLAKSKTLIAILFKANFLLSLVAFMGFYWAMFGARFGIGFGILILIHEMGHFIDIKRRGLPADMPVFLPGLGAYVRWQALGVSAETRAEISLAGPLAGLVAAIGCAFVWARTGNDLWAALARSGAWLNAINLTPVWMLDGGQAASVLSKGSRWVLLTACLALWLVFRESVFFIVALGAGWRLFTKDLPAESSNAILGYFLAILSALGLVMWLMPGQGFGAR